jgi:hypothetical protein
MTEERLEQFVKRTLEELDPVPPTPREEMWASIERSLPGKPGAIRATGLGIAESESQQQRRFSKRAAAIHTRKVWLSWGAGIAATLAIGIGIGRFTATNTLNEQDQPVAATAPTPVNRTAYRLTVAEHLTSAEALLTSFRAQSRGALDPEIAIWARDLLSNTRLMLDSPAADDPNTAALLEDLELIIAQIARMTAPSSEETAIIRDGMNKTAVLPRLRATLPAGPATAGT